MTSTLGAPFGAAFGVNGVQSGLESRTSSLMVPLKSAGGFGVASVVFLSWAKTSLSRVDAANQPHRAPMARTAKVITLLTRMVSSSEWGFPQSAERGQPCTPCNLTRGMASNKHHMMIFRARRRIYLVGLAVLVHLGKHMTLKGIAEMFHRLLN